MTLQIAFPLLFSLLSLLLGQDEAEIVFAGDAMMHQGQIDAAKKSDGSYDFSEYFTEITPYVASADYAVVNLETPVSTPPYSGYPCFNAPESYVDALSNAGFKMFLTANNHTLDRRDKGLTNTVNLLDRKNLDHIGTYPDVAYRNSVIPVIKNINGIRVGFLNYTYGTNGITPGATVKVDYIDRDLIKKDVNATREAGAEVIIACIHWGIEYQLTPHPSQKSLADYIHSLGVEIIIGGHPHVIQPFELVDRQDGRKQLTVYSLGNFISNMKTTDTRGGAMLRLRLTRNEDGIVDISDASYRLIYTEPATSQHNYRLVWADATDDARAKAFSKSARAIFARYNKNISEDIPGILRQIIKNAAPDNTKLDKNM